jgi:hypothetical protein
MAFLNRFASRFPLKSTSTNSSGMVKVSLRSFSLPEHSRPFSGRSSFTASPLFSFGRVPSSQPVALVDFLRLMPQKIPDYRAARTSGTSAACRVKNQLKTDFLGSYARIATNC